MNDTKTLAERLRRVKLTKAQRRMLEAADRGGVLAFGVSRLSQENLQRRGLLTQQRDSLGYYRITDLGRQALSQENQDAE